MEYLSSRKKAEKLFERREGKTNTALSPGNNNQFVIGPVTYDEGQCKKLIGNAPVGIAVCQEEKFVFINNKGLEIIGIPNADELLEKTIDCIADRNSSREMVKQIKCMETGKSVVPFEQKLIKPDGTTIIVKIAGITILFNGQPAAQIIFNKVADCRDPKESFQSDEERYRNLIDFAPDAFLQWDTTENIITVNNKAINYTGYTREELLTMNITDLFFVDKNESCECKNSEQCFSLQNKYEIRCKNGTLFPVEINSCKMSDGSCQAFLRDVTCRLKSEKLLADERVLLRTLIDNLPDGIYAKDAKGRRLFENRINLKNHGLTDEKQVIGKTDFEIYPYEQAARSHKIDQEIILTGKPVVNKKEHYLSRDGKEQWFQISRFPLYTNQGEIFGMVGINRNITLRLQHEQKIIQISKAIEQSPASIIITNTEGIIEYVNKKFVETSGYSAEELRGKILRILKPGHNTADVYRTIWNNLKNGREWSGEHMNRRKSGKHYWESVLLSPVKDNEGKVINFIAISEDITLRKKMEADLLRAKKKAEESDCLKSAFINNMSHEVRTPLNAIVGFSELLCEGEIPGNQSNYFIEIIHNSSDHLLNVISNIMNISSIDAGQTEVAEKRTNVNNLLVSLSEQFRLSNKNRSIEIRYVSTLNDQDATVLTDDVKLMQILSNLIVNALKFTEKGKVEFGVTQKEGSLHFWVEDTGIGIAEEMHEKIFERFRQADSSINKKYGGTGLGLSIAKSFVEILGGTISLTSEVGSGTRFYFNIPYQPAE